MATEVILPRLGQGMETGTIVRWLKSEGDPVTKGEALFELDTDKVTQEVEAEASGVLLRIAVAEGEVPVGQTVAFIGDQGETLPEPAAPPAPAAARDERPSELSRQGATNGSSHAEPGPLASPGVPGGRVKASPLARRIARERGIDLATLRGTGPDGRVVAEDVERAAVSTAVAVPAWLCRRRPARSSGALSRTSGGRSPAGSPPPGRYPPSSSPSRST